ncbi:flagellar biosynthesis anti-sigma factor FlgM [Haloimpatiens sp. FM7330]|uniref:flagellar biosynthesis anti-sigma factor FlgM n=1 Tax=Haloimpatiens sp. FM7330 TaxID=3298610 RepID=UPI0036353E4A
MKISGVSTNKVINLYKARNISKTQSKSKVNSKDSLQISELGKSLSSFSIEDNIVPDNKTVEKIKTQIRNGTYKVDTKALSQKIMEMIEGKEI